MLVEQRQAEKPEVRECAEGHDKDVSGRAHATGCRDASAQAGEADSRLADASDSRCQEHPRANGVPIREIEGLDVPRSANGFFYWEAAANKNCSDDLVRLTNGGRRSWTAARRLEPMSRT